MRINLENVSQEVVDARQSDICLAFLFRHVGTQIAIEAFFARMESAAAENVDKKRTEGKNTTKLPLREMIFCSFTVAEKARCQDGENV